MHYTINNLLSVNNEIEKKSNNKANIIAVSKTFPIEKIMPLIEHGHEHFGENKVQEAVEKWSNLKKNFANIKLHLVGKLQTNKVKYALPLFDYIHSLDTIKLAEKIANEQQKKNFKPKIFIQVNIGKETQKNGVEIENLEQFYLECKKNFDLNIIGLMCLPPNEKSPNDYFSQMQILKNKLNLNDLSMGMTNDYIEALNYEATFIRIGSKIFGERG